MIVRMRTWRVRGTDVPRRIRRVPPRRGEAGGVTVLASVVLLALLTLTILLAQVGVAVVGGHRAQSAADLAAVAAATGLSAGSESGCARAREIGSRMGMRVIDCAVREWDVTVTVESGMSLGPLGTRSVRAKARAGPIGHSD